MNLEIKKIVILNAKIIIILMKKIIINALIIKYVQLTIIK